jgi:hypothetical protein
MPINESDVYVPNLLVTSQGTEREATLPIVIPDLDSIGVVLSTVLDAHFESLTELEFSGRIVFQVCIADIPKGQQPDFLRALNTHIKKYNSFAVNQQFTSSDGHPLVFSAKVSATKPYGMA